MHLEFVGLDLPLVRLDVSLRFQLASPGLGLVLLSCSL